MRFTAKLVTDRELERGMQKFAPDLVNAEGVAVEFLKANGCIPGDRFDIYENRQVLVTSLMLNKEGGVDRLNPETK